MTTLATSAGTLNLHGIENTKWEATLSSVKKEDGIELITLRLHAPQPQAPPRFTLAWKIPQIDLTTRITPSSMQSKTIPPDWSGGTVSDLAHFAPLMTLASEAGKNRLTFAFSDAVRRTELKAGFTEEDATIDCRVTGFLQPETPIDSYEAILRLDTRAVFYADAIRDTVEWFAAMPRYTPCHVPDHALRPVYSTWYSYHQNISESEIEQECRLAGEFGMGSVIVDDGWQTADNQRGYAYCGDWEIAQKRFSDIRRHVDRIHAAGMKYLFWFSVPFIGLKSRAYPRFQGKYLYINEQLSAAVLDPRFPEVREYLIGIYSKALRDWNLDGLKLDFIDSFTVPEERQEPALAENYAGRDCKTVPEAVDLLLTETMKHLRAIKPDVMIEFRQAYIGPAIRKYGNMFRAADCPGDILSNRVRTIDLRLTSGGTAVHSDMITWNSSDSVESAARQFLNILFSVPQISVRLAEIPDSHAQMLRFWLNFWNTHRETLMHGVLTPHQPQLNYPLISAEDRTCCIAAVYASGTVIKLSLDPRKEYRIVNASGTETVTLDIQDTGRRAKVFSATGTPQGIIDVKQGLLTVKIPVSGMLAM